MSVKQKKYTYLILTLLFSLAIILTCSDKIINNVESESVEFDIELKFASQQQQEISEIVTTYQVKIIADADTIVAPLTFSDGSVTGLVEDVPAGPDRKVIVEGLAADSTVIYRGSTTVTVLVGQIVDAVVTLEAVGKLIRITPKYANHNFGTKLLSSVKVNNILELTAIDITIAYDANVVTVDSVSKGSTLPSPANFSYDAGTLSIINIQVMHSTTMADTAGNVTLAQIHFSPVSSNSCLDSTLLDLTLNSLTPGGSSPADIYVDDSWVRVNRGKLLLTPSMLAFGAGVNGLNLDFKQVNVTDSCGNAIPFTISTSTDWIDLNPAQAGLTPGLLYIDVDTTGLNSGFYEGTVRVTAPRAVNSPFDIDVTLEIDKGARVLDIIPDTLYFVATENEALPPIQTFRVIETNGFAISYNFSENVPWLSVTGDRGATPDTLTAAISTTALVFGTYYGTVTITSPEADNSPQLLTVVYTVNKGPRFLKVVPESLFVTLTENGELPSISMFTISEEGGNSIPILVTTNSAFLSFRIYPPIVGDTLPVTYAMEYTTTEIEPGSYTDSIIISSPEATNSPIYLTVVTQVLSAPKSILTIPDSLHLVYTEFSGSFPSGDFIVREFGGYQIPFDVTENISWLSVSNLSGTTEDTIIVTTDPEIGAGVYVDSIQISSAEADNSPIFVVVTLEVQEALKYLATDVDNIYLQYTEYSDEVPTGHFNLYEVNGYNIPFSAIENIDWLTLSEVGTLTPDDIDINVSTNLSPGVYVDSIMLTSVDAENSPIYVKVYYEIVDQPMPMLLLNPDTLYFLAQENGSLPSADDFMVSSSSYQTTYNTTETIDWLDISNGTGSTPGTVTASITSTILEPNVYFDSIYVYSEDTNFINAYEYIQYTVVDTIAPDAVADLSVDSITTSSAYLSWTASGDDSTDGTAAETDIRYSTNLTTLLDWTGATQVDGEPSPQTSGSNETFEVDGLLPGNTYYFALDIIDNVGNHSSISNVDSVYIPLNAPDAPILVSPADGSSDLALIVSFVWNSANGAERYELQYDSDSSFGSPTTYSNLTDTIQISDSLGFETIYYWRVRSYNIDANSNWSSVWSFSTLPTPPTIAGLVEDANSNPIEGALVTVYDNYPSGSTIDSVFSDINGRFEVYDVIGSFELRTFYSGHYPALTSVQTPDTNILIELTELEQFDISDQWVDFYCNGALTHGEPIQINDVVEAFDPYGNLCGQFVVTTPGAYGFMPVYRDESSTAGIDEGCETNDIVTFKVNQETGITPVPAVYPAGINQQIEACFDVTGETGKFIVVYEPSGGETFFVDSSMTIGWTSTGITGPLELYLTNSVSIPMLLDTIDNDGEHIFTIPNVEPSDDWYISLIDINDGTTGSSELFTIDAVELAVSSNSLLFTGVIDKCSPDSQRIQINEVHGFAISYTCTESAPWLSLISPSGTTPNGKVTVKVNSAGLSLGTYIDSIEVSSPNAVNSPQYIVVQLDVAEFICGDLNNDCKLRTGDLGMLIDYLYKGGPAPLFPASANVDLCDDIDIADVEFWTSHYEFGFDVPCIGADFCTDQSYDFGAPDSLIFEETIVTDTSGLITMLQLDLYLYNDMNQINAIASGFSWDNPKLRLDSVVFTQLGIDPFSFQKYSFEKNNIDTTNANQRFLFAASKNFPVSIAPMNSRRLLATYFFTATDWTESDSAVIDRLTFNKGTTYKAVSSTGSYEPQWGGAIILSD